MQDKFPFDYTIKKSARAKNMSLRIDQEGQVSVTIPKRVNEKSAHAFVEKKSDWIILHLEKIPDRPTFDFITGEKLPYLGEKIKLYIRQKDIKHAKANIVGDSIIVFINNEDSSSKKLIKEAITKCYKKNFREIVTEGVDEYNKHYNFKYNRIALKDNKTNWGSCSSKGNLNFNWRLIMAPMEILDYVVIHEVCHLKEQNHAEGFWKLVEEQCPDYKVKRKWLKKNGMKLRL